MENKKLDSTKVEGIVYFVLSSLSIVFLIFSHKKLGVEWKLSPYLFPLFVSCIIFVLSIFLFFKKSKDVVDNKKEVKKENYFRLFLFILEGVVYYFILRYLGFVISTILFLSLTLLLLNERRWYVILIISIVTTLSIYFLFGTFLHVMLPKGFLGF